MLYLSFGDGGAGGDPMNLALDKFVKYTKFLLNILYTALYNVQHFMYMHVNMYMYIIKHAIFQLSIASIERFCTGRSFESTSTRLLMPVFRTRSLLTTRSSRTATRAPRSSRSACATRGAATSTRATARRGSTKGASSAATSARAGGRRSTSSRLEATTVGTRARDCSVSVRPRATSQERRSPSTCTTTRSVSRSPEVTCTADASVRTCTANTSTATSMLGELLSQFKHSHAYSNLLLM